MTKKARFSQGESNAPPRLVGSSIHLGGKSIPLRSGALHYWRLHRERWPLALSAVRDLGLRIVESYVPWRVHERSPGEYDFGSVDPRKDLNAFLDAAEDAGLYVFLRPGPHINAELTCFGLPERIVRDREMQARSPRGNPVALYFPPRMFAVPSHCSDRYHEAVQEWFNAVGAVVSPRLFPRGPVVMLQVDNEGAYYFRNGPFCQDYHPDALRDWHRFAEDAGLEPERSPPSALGEGIYGERISDDELHRQLTWAAFQEYSLAHAITRMKHAMQRAGMRGVPFVHNLSLGEGGLPLRVPELARQVDAVGLDYYHSTRDLPSIKRRTLYLAANTDAAFAPEMGVGAPPWFKPLRHEDSLFSAMAATAYGLRGFNLYMTVDRERWYGGIVDQYGRSRPGHTDWTRFIAGLEQTRFHELESPAKVALVIPAEYVRLTRATHVMGLLSPSILEASLASECAQDPGPTAGTRSDDLGLGTAVQRAWWKATERVAAALSDTGVPFHYLDSESSARYWRPYSLLFSPSFSFADEERFRALERSKAHAVVGPELPSKNASFRQASFPSIECLDVFDDDVLRSAVIDWIDRFDLERPFATQPDIETRVHRREGRDIVLFVINGTGDEHKATVRLPRPTDARDVISQESFSGETTLILPMKARTVRMLELFERRASHPPRARRTS